MSHAILAVNSVLLLLCMLIYIRISVLVARALGRKAAWNWVDNVLMFVIVVSLGFSVYLTYNPGGG